MTPFQQFINNISHDDLQRLSTAEVAIGCDDNNYCLLAEGVILADIPDNPDEIVAHLLAHEQEILQQLYVTQPLCREEFDHQAKQLIEEQGPERFYRSGDNSWALMIDGSFLTAVPPEDVRSQYGYYCEGDTPLSAESANSAVYNWIKTGDAYEDYRVKTHCRYICQ